MDDKKEKEVVITYESLFDLLRIEKNKEELQKLDENFFEQVLDYLKEKKEMFDKKEDLANIFMNSEKEKTRIQIENIKKIVKEIYDRREKKIITMAINKSRTAMNIMNTGNMLEVEKELFEKQTQLLTEYRMDILLNIVNGQMPPKISMINNTAANCSKLLEINEKNSENLKNTQDSQEQNQINNISELSKPNRENQINEMNRLINKTNSSNLTSDSSQDSTQEIENCSNKFKRIKIMKKIEEIVGPDLEIYGPYNEGDEANLPNELANALINNEQARTTNTI